MKIPPNYGAAYVREFDALYSSVATAAKAPLVPFFFEGFGERSDLFQAGSHSSDRGGTIPAPRQRLAHAAAASGSAPMIDSAARRQEIKVSVERIADFPERIDVRSASEFAEDHVPGAENHPVLDDAERARIGTMHAQESAFAARRAGAAVVARNIATMIETSFATEATRLGAARLLLAGGPAQPLARSRDERDRMACRSARGRLSRVSPEDRGASRGASGAAFAIRSSAGSRGRGRAG
jgi:hypothetical protein